MSPDVSLSYEQMSEQLHLLLGRFFVTFAGVELNLSLRVGGAGFFSEKLNRFIDDLGDRFSDSDEEFAKIATWYMAADSIREARNLFAHGRWGILQHAQLIAHVSGYPPDTQVERRFPLSMLDSLIKDTELLNKELSKIAW
jgi:hypothetical protein